MFKPEQNNSDWKGSSFVFMYLVMIETNTDYIGCIRFTPFGDIENAQIDIKYWEKIVLIQ